MQHIEIKLKIQNDFAGWEIEPILDKIPVKSKPDEPWDKFVSACSATVREHVKTILSPEENSILEEIRWNFSGSTNGHYLRCAHD